ncbi:MAG: hypothetical protein ABI451_05870 [Dokdonella sp.]
MNEDWEARKNRIETELEKMRVARLNEPNKPKSAQLYAAMQSLWWVIEPETSSPPCKVVLDGLALSLNIRAS